MEKTMTRKEAVALLERYSNYDGMGMPNLAGCKEAIKVAVDALKEALPELAESEDEKTRKEIKDFILYKAGHLMDEATEHRFVAYLEKQKESKVVKFDHDIEQKPVEWSEDEKMVKAIEHILYENYSDAAIIEGVEIAEIVTWLENQKEQKTDGKAMLHVAEKSYQIGLRDGRMDQNAEPFSCGHENGLSEKPNNQWSEEDERMLVGIIERGSAQIPPFEPALREEQMEWLMNRLKSLRPQPHWKPSEEQMDSLHNAIVRCKGYSDTEHLPELYEDLKKL